MFFFFFLPVSPLTLLVPHNLRRRSDSRLRYSETFTGITRVLETSFSGCDVPVHEAYAHLHVAADTKRVEMTDYWDEKRAG